MAEREVVLRISGLSKAFPGTQALEDVELELRRGEIHALVGGNGSGKSTLVKILAGIHSADAGSIEVGGTVFEHGPRPREARSAGLHFVHQDAAVFPDLSIADNLAIGRGFETDPTGRIRRRAMRRQTERILERFAIDADPETLVAALRPSARTKVAIARALQDQEGRNAGVLVLDEPTASLPDPDVALLLEALRRYAAAGQAMLYVSHRLDEVLGLAERVSVLRDGRKVRTVATAAVDHACLVESMVGSPLGEVYPRSSADAGGAARLEVSGLEGGLVRDVTFRVAAGEIVALAGLPGAGAEDVLQYVSGRRAPAAGTVLVAGKELPPGRLRRALARDVYYLPGDREHALFAGLDVRENLAAPDVSRYWSWFFMRTGRERRDARATIDRFAIRATSESQPVRSLSGGNQQKVALARWLSRRPSVLLLEEPTRGVDVAARADIYRLIRAAADDGAAVLLSTPDLDEIAGLSDRALVLGDGRIVGELHRPDIDARRLTELSYRQPDRGAAF